MKAYKLTNSNGQTRNNTQWGENVTHTITPNKTKPELCSDSWIHFYECPLVAILINPIHADFVNPQLWECETGGEILKEPLKAGCKSLTTIRQIPLPKINITQKAAFAILCVKQIWKDTTWNKWADEWLNNTDRTIAAANYAASAAAATAADAATADAATAAAANAAYAAANAAYAAANANYAACVAAASATAACVAAASATANYAATAANYANYAANYAITKIDFVQLASKAMTY